jgi:hypothetical protein
LCPSSTPRTLHSEIIGDSGAFDRRPVQAFEAASLRVLESEPTVCVGAR